MTENEIATKVINCSIKVHKELGPGLLEKVYEEALCYMLRKEGLKEEKQKELPIFFDGVKLESVYKLDLLVEDKLIIELKSVESLSDIHLAQTLTYLKLGGLKLGLLINFNVSLLKNGIKRVINGNLES